MNIRNSTVIMILGFLVMLACKKGVEKHPVSKDEVVAALVSPDEITSLGDRIVWIDARSKDRYESGHIKGAINLSRKDLTDTTFPYSGIKASREDLEALLRKSGIQNGDYLVLYDDGASAEACRLWWILSHYGYQKSSLLQGGLKAWQDSGRKISLEVEEQTPSDFTWQDRESLKLWISKEDLHSVVNNRNSSAHILDVRSPEEYSGALQRQGAKRPGHIPGSININWVSAMDTVATNSFMPLDELRAVYKKFAEKESDTIIVYCQSGVRSSHTAFVLSRILGYKNVMNYDGSWAEWSFFEELPVVVESAKTD